MSQARPTVRQPDPRPLWLDRLLARRGNRHNTLGPTGARVFCAHLDNAFGLCGRFCFVHDLSAEDALTDPARLTISANGEPLDGNRAACMWYPSHSRRQIRERKLGVVEAKFITWDDVLCDVVSLTNHGSDPLIVRLEVATAATSELARTGKDTIVGHRSVYGQRLNLVLAMRATRTAPADRLICELRLEPGEQTSLLVALGVGLRQNEAQKALSRWAACDDPLAEQQHQYQRWFDVTCPRFDCPDERFTRLWWYRWFLVRRNLSDARTGTLTRTVCYPGKSGPLARLSAAHGYAILREVRWLRDPALAHSQILAHSENTSAEGLYQDSLLQEPIEPPTTPALDAALGLPAAFAEALRVHPLPGLQTQLTAGMASYLTALRKQRDPNHNLLVEGPDSPNERVDSTAFFAASLQATADALAQLGKKIDAQWHGGLAEKCREALLSQLWSDWDRCFADAGEAAEAGGARALLPFALGLVPDEPKYAEAFAALVDTKQLWSPYPVAEASQRLVREAVVRPELNAMIAEVMADAVRNRQQNTLAADHLMTFVGQYAGLMFEDGDLTSPQSREHYSGLTGLGSGALDVLTDSFNDLLIRLLVGLSPWSDDALVLDPLATGWSHFRLDQVPYHGHLLTVIWE
ncbi:MAG: hypothetical protein WCP21_04865, partial [Armatimonadota bacterium]